MRKRSSNQYPYFEGMDPRLPESTPPPEAPGRQPEQINFETIHCQYCEDVGICTYCERGKREAAEEMRAIRKH